MAVPPDPSDGDDTAFRKSRVAFADLVCREVRAAGSSALESTEAPVGLAEPAGRAGTYGAAR